MEGSKSFGLVLIAMAIWAMGYGIELQAKDLETIKTWLKIEYIGIAALPSLWLAFILYYTNRKKQLDNEINKAVIILTPLITFFLVATNDLHHLHFKEVGIIEVLDNQFIAELKPGFWYVTFTIYFYLLLAVGFWYLYQAHKQSTAYFKLQSYYILIAAIIPWIINFLYVVQIRPYNHLDLTPAGFIVSAILIAISLFRFKLFDLVPFSKENILESLSDGIIVLNEKLEILYYNSYFIDYLSLKKVNSYITKNIKDVLPQIYHVFDKNKYLNSFSATIDIIHEDKTNNFIITKNTVEKDGKQQPIIIVTIKDITEIKWVESKLKQSQNRYQVLYENINDIFIQVNEMGVIEEVSPNIESETGFLREQIIGQAFSNIIFGDKSYILKHFFSDEQITEIDFKLKNIWEKPLYVSFKGYKTFENGKYKGFGGTIRNITERVSDKKLLIENQHKLLQAQSISKLAYWEYDIKKDRLNWSDSMYDLLKVNKDSFVLTMENFKDLLDEKGSEACTQSIKNLLNHGDKIKFPFTVCTNDGSDIRYFEAINQLTIIEDKRMIFGVMMDVTPLRKTQNKLEEQNKYLREIAQMQSHQVRSPLTSILGLIDLIEEKELDEELDELIKNLKKASFQLDSIIHEITKKTQIGEKYST